MNSLLIDLVHARQMYLILLSRWHLELHSLLYETSKSFENMA